MQAGARGYLLKESAGVEVAEAVRAIRRGERYLSQRIASAVVEEYLRHEKPASPLEALTPREREVLQLIVEGKSSAEVARLLSLSTKTVETYRSRLHTKLGIPDLPGLVRFAILHGLISLE